MTPRRRASDQDPWVVKYWPIITVLLAYLVAGVIGYVHLEDHVANHQGRMDFHWGKEW